MYIKRLFVIHIALFFAVVIYGQETTAGRDFWFSFGRVTNADITTLQLRIVTTAVTNINVVFPGNEVYNTSANVGANMTQSIYLPAAYFDGAGTKSVHIIADKDILVYVVNMSRASTDATAILPTNALGTSYYHLSYPSQKDGYTIVAVEDDTRISDNGNEIILNQGEVYYSTNFTGDSTGKHITANRKFACFVTNACAEIPANTGNCECLYEQLYPDQWWGRHFFVPVSIRGKEIVRIVAQQNDTKIFINGTLIGSINAGEWKEIEVDAAQNGCYIKTTHPVGVASYLTGISYGGFPKSSLGAPAMAWIPPIEQTVNEISIAPFYANGSSYLTEHHLLIVVPTPAKNQTAMRHNDGTYTSLTGGEWHDHSSGYSYYTLPLESSDIYRHDYSIKNPEGLIVYAYGLGNIEAYYYLTGSTLLKDTYFEVNDSNYQKLRDTTTFCDSIIEVATTVSYPMNAAPGHLRWVVDGAEQSAFTDQLHWTTSLSEGKHTISMIAKYKYGEPDTLTTSFAISLPRDTTINDTICQFETYNNKVYETAGIVRDTLKLLSIFGCDSIVYLNLYINPVGQTSFKDTVCLNEPYNKMGFSLPAQKKQGDSTYYTILTTPQGCSLTVYLHLYVDAEVITIKDSICQNESYHKNGFDLPVQTEAGLHLYSDTLPPSTAPECSTIVYLELQVNPVENTIINDTVYFKEQYEKNGFSLSAEETGTIKDTLRLLNKHGCDSIVYLNLQVNPVIYDTICQYEPYEKYGFSLPAQTIADTTFTYYTGDSPIRLFLHINPTYEKEKSARIETGMSYTEDKFNIPPHDSKGIYDYQKHFTSRNGCDSLVNLHLEVYVKIYPDKIFTPNGDGLNDKWTIKNIEKSDYKHIYIYDRFGKLLYEYNKNEFTSWDGTYLEKPLPSTDYWYLIIFKGGRREKGHFTLMR
ncbi:hypothetical protein FACS189434_07330 [Bacteroidia bacterium]|nr:hypothetical protein FACS189434_07330 [Bacteroidia bacterium]